MRCAIQVLLNLHARSHGENCYIQGPQIRMQTGEILCAANTKFARCFMNFARRIKGLRTLISCRNRMASVPNCFTVQYRYSRARKIVGCRIAICNSISPVAAQCLFVYTHLDTSLVLKKQAASDYWTIKLSPTKLSISHPAENVCIKPSLPVIQLSPRWQCHCFLDPPNGLMSRYFLSRLPCLYDGTSNNTYNKYVVFQLIVIVFCNNAQL